MSLVTTNSTSNQLINKKNNKDDSNSTSLLPFPVMSLQNHKGSVLCAKFSNIDGNIIASGGLDHTIQLWNTPTIENINLSSSIEQNDNSETTDAAISDSIEGLNIGTLMGHKSAVTSIDFSTDNSYVISASADRTIGFWDIETGKRIRKCQGHELCINQVANLKSGNENLSISCSDDSDLIVWDIRYKYPSIKIDSLKNYPLLSCDASDDNLVYCSGIDPTIYCFDLRFPDKFFWKEESLHQDSITSLKLFKSNNNKNDNDDINDNKSIIQNGNYLFSRSMDETIRYYDVSATTSSNNKSVKRSKPYIYNGSISGDEDLLIRCDLNNKGTTIISGSADNTISCWDFLTRKLIDKLPGHRGTVIDVNFHPIYDNILLSSSTDGSVIVREHNF
ncbi:unnamed protein product [[Candida] boidinii]|uniref:Unnamed protein product n=1 Tax=Candida boidinii TaxID=5477 RepID=A0A9W6WJ59_CANBO|nr:hypothetical protein B5S30_g2866 [[Candida] boidinii]OWB83399.1 hypothetical protein B5S33_g2028 [[Candida] boidinii]GME76978.1 unnamed protein product [[Candida] boidinii]GMG05540.1 unnamed protein product [[Candida] boidinii]